jgi:inositol-phosphate phosphatase/L-galactose 1-phosphate phosphatase/histidinol-phosphatase
MTQVPQEFIDLAHQLADAARPVALKYFRTPVPIDDKADSSPVTIADKEIEATMRALINQAHPGHGILGEEHGRENTDAEWVWVLDPIDGTAAFITGKPSFGTLIALAHNGTPVLGIIDQPFTRERWVGALGHSSTLNGAVIHARDCPRLAQAYAFTTAPELFSPATRPQWDKVAAGVKRVRYGCDCYAYGLVAAGFADIVVEAGLKPYDYCALAPVLQGAGGVMTDWDGQPLSIASDGRVIAAGDARIHAEALGLLA